MASLRIKLPGKKGEMTHVLAGQRITIGRRPENTIQIVDGTVSAHHAELIVCNGHYRLHDLGSTNRTCVEGRPVTDYHLHLPCKLLFGSVECEFNPEPATVEEAPAEIVPTRAELDYLRHENLQLQSTIAAQQKRIDILSSARLTIKETTALGDKPDNRRQLAAQNEELRAENDNLKSAIDNLKADLVAVTRDRDATRQAWLTLKSERKAGSTVVSNTPVCTAAPAEAIRTSAGAKSAPELHPVGKPLMSPDAHRAMATVLVKAPPLLESVRKALGKVTGVAVEDGARQTLLEHATALAECVQPIKGHPVQRLAASLQALIADDGPIDPPIVATLNQAADLARSLLEGKHLKRVKDLSHPRVLAIDDDNDLLTTIASTLGTADIRTSCVNSSGAALELLRESTFDLVLLDIALPEESGMDLCPKIREIPAGRRTPIVFVTARDTVDNRARSSVAGGNDFIPKPFNTLGLALKSQIWIYRHQFALL